MDVEKELFAAYAFYAGIVTLKMLMMSPLTTKQRLKTKTFICSEDIAPPFLSYKTGKNDDVERVRRAHQNDIENIVPFLVSSISSQTQNTQQLSSFTGCLLEQEFSTPLSTCLLFLNRQEP